ncbi:MAG: hypothetical protein CFE43_07820 [Burkholderiales bacterium PBB3]|nr:MAG: hypothetical protein CFE43_07820 [Burkholderiales bacterium PBB3]
MLYKFKSQATGDLIMLEPNGRQMLTLIGKGDAESLIKGILIPADIPAAIQALQHAITQEEEAKQRETPETEPATAVSLRQRAAPLLKMMQRCQAEDTPIVWGV